MRLRTPIQRPLTPPSPKGSSSPLPAGERDSPPRQLTENFISLIASEFVTHPPTRLVA